uniref:Leucine-rich repeat-containing N-terminal plant-type domain-containing protein n=1 Tax=Neobodo designis TaxID=312471 RepID=A0A7S1QA73_NEODS
MNAVIRLLVLSVAMLHANGFMDKNVHAPFVDPKQIDVALKKLYEDCNGKNWPSPWGDRWGRESSCAWDGNERAKPPPFGTRCTNGGWHKLPPQDDGGLLFLEHFSGAAEGIVPREFEACQMTEFLSFWNNKLRGPIWNTSMHEFMNRFDLSHNEMSGPLPDDFMARNLRMADLINLAFNKFSGPIPKVIGTFKVLNVLRLDHNEFSGAVPAEITDLPELRHFGLANNKLSGQVPSLKGLKSAARIDLSNNQFDGSLPELPDSVSRVDFSGNKFTGEIPASYGQLPFLRHFNCTGCDVKCSDPNLLVHLPFSSHCPAGKRRKWES